VSALLPADRLDVHLALGTDDDERSVSLEAAGISWAGRRDSLVAAVAGD
jgi:hypothetical protein